MAHTDSTLRVADHLQELRTRLLFVLGTLFVGTVIGYFLHPSLLALLLRPLKQPVFYTSPAGGLDFILKLCFLFGIVVSLPVLTYQVVRFVEPALPKTALRKPLLIVVMAALLCVLGMGFAYAVSLPAALYFLHAFAPDDIQALISTDAYFSFAARYLLGFGILFQLPLALWLLNTMTPITTRQLMGYQRWVIVVSFIIAAGLTPTPDMVNQLMMAVPLIALYQLSIACLWVTNRRRPQPQ